MVDAWPDDLPHGLIDFEPVGGGQSGGAFGGLAPAIGANPAGPHWRASVSQIALFTGAEIRAARAMEGFLDGGAGAVYVPCCDAVRPNVISAAFADDYAAGETDVALAYVGDALRGGEHFSVDVGDVRRLHRIVELLPGSPAMVRITPPLRDPVSAADALDFAAPSCPMQLESGFNLPINLQRFGQVEATFTEYFPRSPAITAAPEPTPTPPDTDARFWRVRAIHTHDGDTLFSPVELGFLDDFAGTKVVGTPVGSTVLGGTVLGSAFDGNQASYASVAGSGGWIGQDNGSPTARPKEFYLTSRGPSGWTQMPSEVAYEESDDGITWSTVKTWSGIPHWPNTHTRYFSIADEADAPWDGASPPQWRRQRVRALSIGAGTEFELVELLFLDVAGGNTSITGTMIAWFVVSGDAQFLIDGFANTVCGVWASNDGWWMGIENGKHPRDQVVQLKMQSDFFLAYEAPLSFVLEGENWAGDWQHIQAFSVSSWGGYQIRRFDV